MGWGVKPSRSEGLRSHTGKVAGRLNELGFLVVGVIFGLFWSLATIQICSQARVGPFLSLAAMFSVPFSATIIHELGHVLGGRLAGIPIRRVHVAPFLYDVDKRRWSLSPPVAGGRVAGFVAAGGIPAKQRRMRLAVFAFAGPAFEIGAGIAIFCFLTAAPYIGLGAMPIWIGALLSSLGLFCVLMGGLNLWPVRVRGFTSDGSIILAQLR